MRGPRQILAKRANSATNDPTHQLRSDILGKSKSGDSPPKNVRKQASPGHKSRQLWCGCNQHTPSATPLVLAPYLQLGNAVAWPFNSRPMANRARLRGLRLAANRIQARESSTHNPRVSRCINSLLPIALSCVFCVCGTWVRATETARCRQGTQAKSKSAA